VEQNLSSSKEGLDVQVLKAQEVADKRIREIEDEAKKMVEKA